VRFIPISGPASLSPRVCHWSAMTVRARDRSLDRRGRYAGDARSACWPTTSHLPIVDTGLQATYAASCAPRGADRASSSTRRMRALRRLTVPALGRRVRRAVTAEGRLAVPYARVFAAQPQPLGGSAASWASCYRFCASPGRVHLRRRRRYILWKIERHSGVKATATPWQRRHPLLAAPGLAWRLYRRGAFR
jgi:hypothetical protein